MTIDFDVYRYRSDGQKRFFKMMLESYPEILQYWRDEDLQFNREKYDLDRKNGGIKGLGLKSNEFVMIRFLAGIYEGYNDFDFDILSMNQFLTEKDREVICMWLKNPNIYM